MERPLISVIIPVYNAEKTLRATLDCLLAQTEPRWEAIPMDDGSKDSSLEILREYAEKDPRIRPQHQENAGPSAARRNAMALSMGDYVTFLDSDDRLDPRAYEKLLVMLQNTHADIAVMGVRTFTDPAELGPAPEEAACRVYSRDEYAKIFFKIGSNETVTYLFNKLFRRDVALRMDPLEGVWDGDDLLPFYQSLLASHSVAVSTWPGYLYYINTEGITHSRFSKRAFDLIRAWDAIVDLSRKEAPQYADWAILNRKRIALTLLYRMHRDGTNAYPQQEAALRAEIKQNAAALLRAPIPMTRKAVALGYKLCYPLTKRLLKM